MDSPEYFECIHCDKKLRSKQNLVRHLKIHKRSNIVCDCCKRRFQRKDSLLVHIRRKHLNTDNTADGYETFEFPSESKFYQWKDDMEKSSISRFRKTFQREYKQCISMVFSCHRSGFYKSKPLVRKRYLKLKGSKKLNAKCPAEIKMRRCKITGVCSVSFKQNHEGHSIGTKEELGHIFLTPEERKELATKIQYGVPFHKILSDCDERTKEVTDSQLPNRMDLLTKQDLSNIVAGFKIPVKTEDNQLPNRVDLPTKQDLSNITAEFKIPVKTEGDNENEEPLNVETFVLKNKESILYYKKQGETDSSFPEFEENDLVVVLMTPDQVEMMREYGNDIIAIDGSLGFDEYDFILQTILVVDKYREGYAAAFTLSNRNDEYLSDVFLALVKDRIGMTLRPNVLMTDMTETFYNSWVKLMDPPSRRLFCTWHVFEDWRRNQMKIPDKNKRKVVLQKLYDLCQEIDEILFEEKFNQFINDPDEDLTEFLFYFCRNYSKNVRCWAYCFRLNATINTNMHVESFNRHLKHGIGRKMRIEQLSVGLDMLQSYLMQKKRDMKIREIRGKSLFKVKTLRARHKKFESAKASFSIKIEEVGNDEWRVSSCANVTDNCLEVHTVNEVKTECQDCPLVCPECHVCLHKYVCTCVDHSIKYNMCEHIHAVADYENQIATVIETCSFEDTCDVVDVPMSYCSEEIIMEDEEAFSRDIIFVESVTENADLQEVQSDALHTLSEVMKSTTSVSDIEIIMEAVRNAQIEIQLSKMS